MAEFHNEQSRPDDAVEESKNRIIFRYQRDAGPSDGPHRLIATEIHRFDWQAIEQLPPFCHHSSRHLCLTKFQMRRIQCVFPSGSGHRRWGNQAGAVTSLLRSIPDIGIVNGDCGGGRRRRRRRRKRSWGRGWQGGEGSEGGNNRRNNTISTWKGEWRWVRVSHSQQPNNRRWMAAQLLLSGHSGVGGVGRGGGGGEIQLGLFTNNIYDA